MRNPPPIFAVIQLLLVSIAISDYLNSVQPDTDTDVQLLPCLLASSHVGLPRSISGHNFQSGSSSQCCAVGMSTFENNQEKNKYDVLPASVCYMLI